MIDYFEQIDQQLFLFLNNLHSPFGDVLMYWISYKFTWIPLYLAVLLYFVYKQGVKSYLSIIFIIGAIALADQTSVHLFKNIFLRYRPCHNLDIQSLIHTVHGHCGGQYGFVSSHAANSFAFAVFAALIIQKKKVTYLFLLWAILVSYSRIYLGVHYPADLFFGGLLGSLISIFLYWGYRRISKSSVF